MISPGTASATSDSGGLQVRGVAGRKQSVGNLVGIERDALRNRHPCLRGGICEGFGGVIVRARRCDFGGGQMTGKPVAQGHAGELRRMDAGLDIIVFWRHGKSGRASCRDRVCQYVYISVVAVSLKKKKK